MNISLEIRHRSQIKPRARKLTILVSCRDVKRMWRVSTTISSRPRPDPAPDWSQEKFLTSHPISPYVEWAAKDRGLPALTHIVKNIHGLRSRAITHSCFGLTNDGGAEWVFPAFGKLLWSFWLCVSCLGLLTAPRPRNSSPSKRQSTNEIRCAKAYS